MTTCKGCGIKIQYENKNEVGYSPKINSTYCQRCFRIIHYDDLMYSMKKGIPSEYILTKLNTMDGLIVWVVDLFDFEASMIDGLNRHVLNKDIILVATKRDLLPKDISNNKITRFIQERLKEKGIKVKGILITPHLEKINKNLILDILDEQSDGKDIIVIGKANTGKSTFINLLIGNDVLTKSRYPGTTLDFNKIEIENLTFIDTPGIEVKNSILMLLDDIKLNTVIPTRTIKPTVYQLNKDQSIALGGLIRIDVYDANKASLVAYVSNDLLIHRTKLSNADKLWENHKGELLTPVVEDKMVSTTVNVRYDKMDIVIDGLGWVCINNKVSKIVVTHPKQVNVTFRKAML
jgi:ribosome biogenesis GTPase YqeH